MTYGAWDIVPRKEYGLGLGKTVGDAFRSLVTARFKYTPAKHVARLWDIDPETAKNIIQKGSISERTLTKAARAEGWAFWMALGEELFGHSYAEWEEERLTKIMEDAARDLERVRRLRPKAEAVFESALASDAVGMVEGYRSAEHPGSGESGRGMHAPVRRASGARQ